MFKLYEIPLFAYLFMAYEGKKSLKFRQTKSNNSSPTDDILMKLYVNYQTMAIYTQYKFQEIQEIPSIVNNKYMKRLLYYKYIDHIDNNQNLPRELN